MALTRPGYYINGVTDAAGNALANEPYTVTDPNSGQSVTVYSTITRTVMASPRTDSMGNAVFYAEADLGPLRITVRGVPLLVPCTPDGRDLKDEIQARIDGDTAVSSSITSSVNTAKNRANHTGTQTASTISDFTEAVQDAVAAFLTAGSNVLLSYDDAANSLTVSAAGSGIGGGLDAEQVRDVIGSALVGSGVVSVTVNDAADTITITSTATQNSSDATLLNRANHTGTQAISTVSGLQSALDGKAAASHTSQTTSVHGIPDTSKLVVAIDYNTGTSSYPARPSGIGMAIYRGPVQPTDWVNGDQWNSTT